MLTTSSTFLVLSPSFYSFRFFFFAISLYVILLALSSLVFSLSNVTLLPALTDPFSLLFSLVVTTSQVPVLSGPLVLFFFSSLLLCLFCRDLCCSLLLLRLLSLALFHSLLRCGLLKSCRLEVDSTVLSFVDIDHDNKSSKNSFLSRPKLQASWKDVDYRLSSKAVLSNTISRQKTRVATGIHQYSVRFPCVWTYLRLDGQSGDNQMLFNSVS